MSTVDYPKKLRIDGRRNKMDMIEELERYLRGMSAAYKSRKRNPSAYCEPTSQAGSAAAYDDAAYLLSLILKKGK